MVRGRIGVLLILVFSIIIGVHSAVFAAESLLPNIDILVELDEMGNAKIQEKWTLYFPEGTESYKVINNKGKLKSFKVFTEDFGEFSNVTPWVADANRTLKTHKSGVIDTGDSYELCWGVGDSFDLKTYTIEYEIEEFIYKYADGLTGFSWEFITLDMYPAPIYVDITIKRPGGFEESETIVKPIGKNTEIKLIEGSIKIHSSNYSSSDSLSIVLGVPESYFNIIGIEDFTFDEVVEREIKLQTFKREVVTSDEIDSYYNSAKSAFYTLLILLVIMLLSIFLTYIDGGGSGYYSHHRYYHRSSGFRGGGSGGGSRGGRGGGSR